MRLRRLAGAVAAFGAALVISGIGGCNLHELGHLITGKIAGVPVNDIIWCTPANGRIAFAYQEPAWVGYAGGLTAATVLLVFYWVVIRRRLDSVYWWSAGVAVLGTAISQVIVAVLEGSDPIFYAEVQTSPAGLATLIVGPLLLAGFAQLVLRPGLNQPEHSRSR